MANLHLEHELRDSGKRAIVETKHGKVTGGRAANDAAVFLGKPSHFWAIVPNLTTWYRRIAVRITTEEVYRSAGPPFGLPL